MLQFARETTTLFPPSALLLTRAKMFLPLARPFYRQPTLVLQRQRQEDVLLLARAIRPRTLRQRYGLYLRGMAARHFANENSVENSLV
jgi:hypothetical protein